MSLAAGPLSRTSAEDQLLAAVADLEPMISQHAFFGEENGQLDPAVVDAMGERGLWRMRLNKELGGLEVSLRTQFDVIRTLAEVDVATAWCTMIANNGVGVIGAYLPQPIIDTVFADGIPRCAIVAGPAGTVTPTEGGYRVTATWRFGSSIRHAQWVLVTSFIDGDPENPLLVVLPTSEIKIHDNWSVVGLKGTGSCDFTATDVFVPQHMTLPGAMGPTGPTSGPALRGFRNYSGSGSELLEAYEHIAIALGIAGRAVNDLRATLARRRGIVIPADREVVQTELAALSLGLEGATRTAQAFCDRVDQTLTGEAPPIDHGDRHKGRALAVWTTDLAVECASVAFRRSGATALYLPNPAEKLLRDAHAARLHFIVNDSALAQHGAALIETA